MYQGIELGRLFAEAEAALVVCRRANQRSDIDAQLVIRQSIRCLQGLTSGRNSFDDAEFDEAAYLAGAQSNMRDAFHCVRRLQTSYLLGDLERAQALTESGVRLLPYHRAFVLVVEHTFYTALVRAALHALAPAEERPALITAITAGLGELRRWAANNPESYRHKELLVEAELAAAAGRARSRRGALRSRHRGGGQRGVLPDEALGNELAGACTAVLAASASPISIWLRPSTATPAGARTPRPSRCTRSSPTGPRWGRTRWATCARWIWCRCRARPRRSPASWCPDRLLEKLMEVCLATAGADRGAPAPRGGRAALPARLGQGVRAGRALPHPARGLRGAAARAR
jgi:hypothetical protein